MTKIEEADLHVEGAHNLGARNGGGWSVRVTHRPSGLAHLTKAATFESGRAECVRAIQAALDARSAAPYEPGAGDRVTIRWADGRVQEGTVESYELIDGQPGMYTLSACWDAPKPDPATVLRALADDYEAGRLASVDITPGDAQGSMSGEAIHITVRRKPNVALQPGVRLTSADPEPPPGTTVEAVGRLWTRHPGMWPGSWLVEGDEETGDPETWTKVAGNYGPVTVRRVP